MCLIPGLVSLYDHEKALSGSRYLRDKLAGPAYAPTSYKQLLQRDMGPWGQPAPAAQSRGRRKNIHVLDWDKKKKIKKAPC